MASLTCLDERPPVKCKVGEFGLGLGTITSMNMDVVPTTLGCGTLLYAYMALVGSGAPFVWRIRVPSASMHLSHPL